MNYRNPAMNIYFQKKELLNERVKEAEDNLKAANDKVYDSLAEVDKSHNRLDAIRQQAREQKYSYLPF